MVPPLAQQIPSQVLDDRFRSHRHHVEDNAIVIHNGMSSQDM